MGDSVDPVLTSAMIQTRRQSLFNVTNPIMIKPKPKPAPPPAPETKPEDKGAPDGKENDGEGKNDIPTSDTPAEESKTAVDESKQEGAMEVEYSERFIVLLVPVVICIAFLIFWSCTDIKIRSCGAI